MAVTTDAHFSFVSKALAAHTFSVVRFTGTEGLSRLYEYEILVSAADAEIDLEAVLRNPATLTVHGQSGDAHVHGVVARIEQLHEIRGRFLYRACLVPRLAQADLYRENQLFLDKSVPDVIAAILKRIGLSGSDYTLKLKRSYPKWEYICQYDETDFAFISRWMEREGIYYYFEQGDDAEKVVITDSADAHEEMADTSSLRYAPRSAMVAERETVTALICRHAWLPGRVILRDYNYRKPSLELKAEAVVDSQGRGDVFSWGEHFKTPEDGKRLAEIRAEEIRCGEQVFHGEATAPGMHPGALFSLEDHYRDGYNQQYLIVEVTHEGAQPEAYLTDAVAQQSGDAPTLDYRNSFAAIPAGVQFRPARKTPRPQLHGTVNARVDAAGDGKYAEIDDQGRYKVRLPFDESGAPGGKASRWVRMAQPHSGPNYGTHFPLHKDAEVLLTFIDGDPDRPIIAAAVPNPETASPVSTANQTQSVIRTGGQNEIVIEDVEGGQKVTIQQACGNTLVLDGTKDAETMTMRQACGNVLTLDGTKGAEKTELKDKYGNQLLLDSKPGDEHIRIFSPHHHSGLELGRSFGSWTMSDTSTFTLGNIMQAVVGTQVCALVGAGVDVRMGNLMSAKLAQEFSFTYGGAYSFDYGYSYSYSKGAVVKSSEADYLTVADSDQILAAGEDVCLASGMKASGNAKALLTLIHHGDNRPAAARLSVGTRVVQVNGDPVTTNPYVIANVKTDVAVQKRLALMMAATLAGTGEAAKWGHRVAWAGSVLPVYFMLLQCIGYYFLKRKVDKEKIKAVTHREPMAAFIELQEDGTIVVQSSPLHGGGINLQAEQGDVVLVAGLQNEVRVGKHVTVGPDRVDIARGNLKVVATV